MPRKKLTKAEARLDPRWGLRVLWQRLALLAVGILVGGAGLLAFYQVYIAKLVQWNDSRNWVEVPVEMVESRWAKGRRTRAEFLFSYSFKGQSYTSDQVWFWQFTNMSGAARDYMKLYPEGAKASGWVNPDNPTQAVIDRRFLVLEDALGVLFLVPFLTVGLAAGVAGLSPKWIPRTILRRLYQDIPQLVAQRRLPGWVRSTMVPPPQVYSTREGQCSSIVGVLAIAVFCSSFPLVGLGIALGPMMEGNPGAWILFLFLIPFLYVSWVLFWGLLEMLRPIPHYMVAIQPAPSWSGGPATISWSRMEPEKRSIRSLEITVTVEATLDDKKETPVYMLERQFPLPEERWEQGEIEIELPEVPEEHWISANLQIELRERDASGQTRDASVSPEYQEAEID